MSYIFGKLWHLAIIWPIRKSFQCILQGVRFLLAKQTRLSGTSDNESYLDQTSASKSRPSLSFDILIKIQGPYLDQTSASISWLKFSFKILTIYQLWGSFVVSHPPTLSWHDHIFYQYVFTVIEISCLKMFKADVDCDNARTCIGFLPTSSCSSLSPSLQQFI